MNLPAIKGLYYITHLDNIPSILENGILSHNLVVASDVSYTPIYDAQIVNNRRSKLAPNGKNLWDFANLYFQPRNPMMYRVIHEKNKDDIAVLAIRPSILETNGIYISTGNAASAASELLPKEEGLKAIAEMRNVINSEWWREDDGSKRKIMAECLVPDKVPHWMIDTIYVAKLSTANEIRRRIASFSLQIEVVPEPSIFFQPSSISRIDDNLVLVQGDMFFSQMQTLTISVNTVGIMGKGLASRAKYQFPDVYVVYQDACRSKKIKPGKPYVYKRERPIDSELAEDSTAFTTANSKKWFLLFPTKRHWRDSSKIDDIEEGLRWLDKNYKTEGIESLAVPALGCGLGGLDWQEVGPLMCGHLSTYDIEVGIYLPREREIPQEFLTPEFLLKNP